MNIVESIKVAINAIFSNKMRSLLTMLGIIIGISSVITVLSLGQGSQKKIDSEFDEFAAGLTNISMNWTKNHSNSDLMNYGDIETLKETFPNEILAITEDNNLNGRINSKGKDYNLTIKGGDQDYIKIDKVDLISGRYLIEEDIKGRRQVAVINKELAMEVFGRTDVVGENIDIDYQASNYNFSIVGVYEDRKTLVNMGGIGTTIYIPHTSFDDIQGWEDDMYGITILLAKDLNNRKQVQDNIINLIERRHDNEGKELYNIYSAEEQIESINEITSIITMVISAIAAISLLVGGIGVMNIMFVSVTERTREIGIRKAIGAKRKDILLQFLTEAVIISVIGGIIGTILGISLAKIIAHFIKIEATISIVSIGVAWMFSAGVGIFFGIYPASKASKLDPIDALRYE